MISPLVFYKCLADETRLNSILLIFEHTELCVCELTEALQLSQPKISRHLAELRKCQLLVDERRGKWVYYQINPLLPAWALTILQETLEASGALLQSARQALSEQNAKC